MTTLIMPLPGATAAPAPEPPMRLGRRHWLAALAILFVLFTPYQTLVQTVITDDAVRKGIEADEYDMTWVTVAYGVGVLYGVFAGLSLSARIGKRYTLALAMLVFSAGNVLCGAATGLVSLAVARSVEGFGKMLAMAVGRVTLYKQFDRALLVAIGFYGIFAYSTRHITPLVNAYLDVYLSWRWMYWAYVPVGVAAAVLVWRFITPDRPSRPMHVPIDWLAITTFVAWIVAVVFAFSWYRKWGGWSSNAFAATVALCVVLPAALVAWLGSGMSPDEHLKRILRTRVYVLSLTTRGTDAPAHGGRADDRRHVLHRAARLPADHRGLADGADLGDDGGDDLPHDPVPPPVVAARLADRRAGGFGGLRVVAVIDRQLHGQGAIGRSCWPAGGRSLG